MFVIAYSSVNSRIFTVPTYLILIEYLSYFNYEVGPSLALLISQSVTLYVPTVFPRRWAILLVMLSE